MIATGFKDLFSLEAASYARFRPRYPEALFDFLAAAAPGRQLALDVGAGSGQAALALASRFALVVALEPSGRQLAEMVPAPGCRRVRSRAEALPVRDATVDLMVAAQAFHWFQPESFFAEARRLLRPAGVMSLISYQLPVTHPPVDALVQELYGLVDDYWEPERRLVEQGYRSVTAPFPEMVVPAFDMRQRWNLSALVGYLGTWSALGRYRQATGLDPMPALAGRLQAAWQAPAGGEREVSFPLVVRAFRWDQEAAARQQTDSPTAQDP